LGDLQLDSGVDCKMKELLKEVAKRCPGGKLPDDYLVFDTETSEVDRATDRILQFGFVVVKGRTIRDQYGFLVKRTRQEVTIHPEAMKVHGIDYDRLEREGVPPGEVIDTVIDLFLMAKNNRMMIVGHNIASFDAPMLERECSVMGKTFKFDGNDMLDTGMIVKAAQIGSYFDPSMSLKDWFRRVAEVRARGVYWNLDRYCTAKFKLMEGGVVKAHDAMGDCVLTHRLLEKLRLCHEK